MAIWGQVLTSTLLPHAWITSYISISEYLILQVRNTIGKINFEKQPLILAYPT